MTLPSSRYNNSVILCAIYCLNTFVFVSLMLLTMGICIRIIWAPSSEFVSSSIPSWQILTAHAQPFRGARDLAFCQKVPLDSLLVWASSEGSGETARMHRLAWTFAARIGDKYQIRLTRSIWDIVGLLLLKPHGLSFYKACVINTYSSICVLSDT